MTPRIPLALTLAALALGAGGCASVRCPRGEQRAVTESLYFGTAMPGALEVSPADWQQFLAEVITPRFPEGLTSWAAAGQWRNDAGELEKESSYVLHIVHSDSPRMRAAIVEVIAIYKERFRQEAVLRVRGAACISF
jgi:Protein of unknown function (DUF3574)